MDIRPQGLLPGGGRSLNACQTNQVAGKTGSNLVVRGFGQSPQKLAEHHDGTPSSISHGRQAQPLAHDALDVAETGGRSVAEGDLGRYARGGAIKAQHRRSPTTWNDLDAQGAGTCKTMYVR